MSKISIHAPRAGGDAHTNLTCPRGWRFQSTPPVRGATIIQQAKTLGSENFNPRPPCGGRPPPAPDWAEDVIFQSTPPVRGATFN